MSLGDRITELRKAKGLGSQRKACVELEVSLNTLWGYENDKNLPDIDFLARFARITGADLQELLALRLEASGEDPGILHLHDEPALYEPTVLHQEMVADRAAAFAGRRAGEPKPAEIAAAVRREVERVEIPMRWGLLLVQLAAVGDLTVNGARIIIELLTGEGSAGRSKETTNRE